MSNASEISLASEELILEINNLIALSQPDIKDCVRLLSLCRYFIENMVKENGQLNGLLDFVDEQYQNEKLRAVCYKVTLDLAEVSEQ